MDWKSVHCRQIRYEINLLYQYIKMCKLWPCFFVYKLLVSMKWCTLKEYFYIQSHNFVENNQDHVDEKCSVALFHCSVFGTVEKGIMGLVASRSTAVKRHWLADSVSPRERSTSPRNCLQDEENNPMFTPDISIFMMVSTCLDTGQHSCGVERLEDGCACYLSSYVWN